MTTATLLVGKRGEGKGLSAVAQMRDYLRDGKMVATNMDIYPWRMVGALNTTRAYRLPDFPTAEALSLLPLGNPGLEYDDLHNPRIKSGIDYKDENNGLLVLDEASTFLNARKWQGDERQQLLDWLAHSRKYGWDLLLIAQGVSQVDKQVRDSLCELFGNVRNLGKLNMPVVSGISKFFFGIPVKMPEIRVRVVRYGYERGAALADRIWFKGKDLFSYYDTLQVISSTGQQGVSAFLTGWEAKGRYMTPMQLHRGAALGGAIAGLLLGAVLGWFIHSTAADTELPIANDDGVTVSGVFSPGDGRHVLMLSDGRTVSANKVTASIEGMIYEAEGRQYRRAK